MNFIILIREFLIDVKKQKVRAFLTTIAITWGTLAVVLLMAFGKGLDFRMSESLLNAGERTIKIYGGQTSKKFNGLPIGRPVRMVMTDKDLILKTPGVKFISADFGKYIHLKYQDKIVRTYMEGVEPSFGIMRRMYPGLGGRFIDAKDVAERRRVVFLGSVIAKEVLGNKEPLGRKINIDGLPFTIIGIMPKKLQSSMSNGPDDRRAIIPNTTFQSIYGNKYLRNILVVAKNPNKSKSLVKEIRNSFARKYNFDPEDEKALDIWDMNEALEITDKIFLGFNLFLTIVGTMTLIIAGVGVANIMHVVVRERTKEIGIKRAIGAKKIHIMFQFIFESLLISITGGTTGIFLAKGIIFLIWKIPAQDEVSQLLFRPILSNNVVFVTVIILTLIGLLAGLRPARQAANLDPVDALRYE
ncbi:ABC transporter permease [bacterium]|nr:ABC transporter permease [bacterium]